MSQQIDSLGGLQVPGFDKCDFPDSMIMSSGGDLGIPERFFAMSYLLLLNVVLAGLWTCLRPTEQEFPAGRTAQIPAATSLFYSQLRAPLM